MRSRDLLNSCLAAESADLHTHPERGNVKLSVTQHCEGLKAMASVYLNAHSNFLWYLELDYQNGIIFEKTKI